jgi:hypothetical protein
MKTGSKAFAAGAAPDPFAEQLFSFGVGMMRAQAEGMDIVTSYIDDHGRRVHVTQAEVESQLAAIDRKKVR